MGKTSKFETQENLKKAHENFLKEDFLKTVSDKIDNMQANLDKIGGMIDKIPNTPSKMDKGLFDFLFGK